MRRQSVKRTNFTQLFLQFLDKLNARKSSDRTAQNTQTSEDVCELIYQLIGWVLKI